ncbi:MAG: DUF4038 domain-containing protein [Verrucomicrobiales bacterium]|nr:DUF4038 domain-containing protein [Verrucomicrobiales bacterium]
MNSSNRLIAALAALCITVTSSWTSAAENPQVWERWEHSLTSSRDYANAYTEVTLRVRFTGPERRVITGCGFWDGGRSFRIRCAFPLPGTWKWETECSDADNAGLHHQRGSVEAAPYRGDNRLHRHGFLKVSQDRRYLTHDDGTPFPWFGDTAWAGPMRSTEEEWGRYLADRRKKGFTVIQVGTAAAWMGKTNRDGEVPFHDAELQQINPAFWQTIERRVHAANDAGLVVTMVGLMEPVERYPSAEVACRFAQHLTARLFGSFVILSPSFDSDFMPLADEVGRATREATAVHLITQHPGTPSGHKTPTFTMKYYDQPYLDIAGVQSGHNRGNRERCAFQSSEWMLHACRHEPHKPVINLEAMYDGHGEKAWQAVDARGAAWRSWLSGAKGYTYGGGETSSKAANGNGGVWKWVSDASKPDHWEKAIQWESAFQMQHLHGFLSAIEWWRLEPAPELIRNQPKEWARRAVLARIAASNHAIAYLPDHEGIDVDLSAFTTALTARWFDPVRGRFDAQSDQARNEGVHRFTPPTKGEWVLVLEAAKAAGAKY